MNRYERYKDSGIPWLGEVPEHWDTMSLKYICDVRDGTHDTPQYVYESDNSYPLVTSKDISNGNINFESAKFISEEDYLNISKRSNVNFGDLLMPMIGTVGGSVLVETYRKFTIKNVALFKAGQFCAKWLKYFLDSELSKIQFELEKNGGVQDFVGLTTLRNLIILKLPLKEQTAIAHYLDTKLGEIDALIDKQQTLLEKLAEQRTAVITHAVTKGLNPAAPMKKSGVEWLGDVPAHWSIIQFRRVVENIKDGTHGTHSRENNGFPLLSAKNVFNDGIHIHDNESQISEEDYKLITSNGFPKKNDLLITCVGSIGRCCIYPFDTPFAFQRSVAFLRLNKNAVPQFYKYFVESTCYQEQLKANVKLSIQGGVYLGTLISMYAILPTKEEQTSIAGYLNQETAKIDRLCETVNQTIGRLKEYRTALITQAVTGKIKVTDE
jgi:restriction modification system DNA specificity domain protein